MGDPGLFLVIGLISGGAAAAIASSKGRNAIGWFFIGFFFGILGLIIAALMPNLVEEERRRTKARSERRRLREQLRQEKMKTEAFRRHASGRIDAHDRVLGVDTRQQAALVGGNAPKPKPLGSGAQGQAPPPPPIQSGAERQWHYSADGESRGPVPESTLIWMLENGGASGSTLVWTEGQEAWVPASSVPALRNAARS